MIVTTSRDPSARARRFAKALASFLSLQYFNRGKQGLDEDELWLIVGEDHGNPARLVKRLGEAEEQLSFSLSGEPEGRRLCRQTPKVAGDGEFAQSVARFFELELACRTDVRSGRIIWAASDVIDFMDEGISRFRLMT
jgi:rRNA maturation protein Rpf1